VVRAGAGLVAAIVGLVGLSPLAGTPTAFADPDRVDPPARETVELSDLEVELPRQANGRTALRLLGDQVADAAGLNDLPVAELREILRTDDSAWLTTEGRLFYREPRADERAATPAPAAPYPLDQTFALHSKPDSQYTIFIDVDGATVDDTEWHDQFPATPADHPAWDPAGDGEDFSAGELELVQAVWALVAEDYAPFDVDVTTEDPGAAAIQRSSSGDVEYGAHALVSPTDAWWTLCAPVPPEVEPGCGGIAFIDVFDEVDYWGGGSNGYGYLQPAWIFPQGTGDSAKSIAEAVSHEVGHQLGLSHDRTATQDYYAGHGTWAPIMGSGYGRPITQWSKGDHPGATNHEDDLAVIGTVLGPRSDEAPTGVTGAPEVPVGIAYVGDRTDTDTFLLGTCTGPVTVAAAPHLDAGANLDLRLRLLDATGSQVASADPASAWVSPLQASGLDAAITRTLAPGRYYAEVDGVGRGTWSSGYDDYGSLGAYRVEVTGDCSTEGVPGAPTALATGVVTADSIGLTWAAPDDPGTSAITEYVLTRSGSGQQVTLPAGATSHTWNGLSPGTSYTFTLRAVNGSGTGSSATVTAATTTTVPSAPRNLVATWEAASASVVATWSAPLTDGGSAVAGFELYVDGRYLGPMRADSVGVRIGGLTPGAHDLGVAAVNAAGTGSVAETSVVVPPLGATTTSLSVGVSGQQVTLAARVAASGTPVGSIRFLDGSNVVGTVALASGSAVLRLADVRPGVHAYRASFVPSSHHAVSTSVARNATIAAPTSRTTIKAPRTAKAGSRPTVTVRVTRGSTPASGKVVLKYGAKKKSLTLRAGTAKLKLPRVKAGKVRLTATYAGNATTRASSAKATIKVAKKRR
jgi:hypothetical protein